MSLSCFDFVDKNSQHTLEEALELLLQAASEGTPVVQRPLLQAQGSHLAADLLAPINVPQHTNSAMDGYALQGAELARREHWTLVGSRHAGQAFNGRLQAGESLYITTGAPLPDGADTVVMMEQCQQQQDRITILRASEIKPGSNVRQAGEDLRQGKRVLAAGTPLGPVQLGLLASLGFEIIDVFQPLKVAVFSTGNEVTAPGTPLPADGIYDTNRFTLLALLRSLGCEVTDLGILPDDLAVMTTALADAAQTHQLVLTSGGVSVGEADFVKQALNQLGATHFWQLAIRPGRPFAFGHLGRNQQGRTCLFAGLPGNPVAVMVVFMLLVQPLVKRLQGCLNPWPVSVQALAEEPMNSRLGRSDFYRAVYHVDAQSQLRVHTTGAQGSGILYSMQQANGLVRLDEQQERILPGQPVTFYPFHDNLPGHQRQA